MLARIARWSFRRRRLMVFAIWLPLVVVALGASGAAGTNFHTSFDLPGGEAKEVQDILSAQVSEEDAGFVAQIVFTAPPAMPTAPIAINAMSATSNAYSSRSWPSSWFANDFT